jgi:arylsulfatase A-like enzyme
VRSGFRQAPRHRRPASGISIFACAALGALLGAVTAHAGHPNVVFVLLDTTRADRFGAWGNDRPTTPALDQLAGRGVAFLRHFANAHATRSSMPQLMTGRYYHRSILRPFAVDSHPREYRFANPDPSAALLPGVLRANGWVTEAVSAHPWVARESLFGAQLDRLDAVESEPSRGHADAPEVIEAALARWRARDRARPLFLYVHLMDMHTPRFLPAGEPRFPVPGYDWRKRFDAAGEPTFAATARRWDPEDASTFTELDRAHLRAVYDTRLALTDEHLGRLLAALADGDPELRDTLVVVTADHGEELGEEGRTGHTAALTDAIQHVPLIVAGAGVPPGQRVGRMSEHVDVLPTVLALLGVPLPAGVRVDGRPQLDRDGRRCDGCGKTAAYFAWEDYRGVRSAHHLLVQRRPASFEARCSGAEQLYRLDAGGRQPLPVGDANAPIAARLRRRLENRLDHREQRFHAHRFGKPTSRFVVRGGFWRLGKDAPVACIPVDESTARARLQTPGWLWTGRGVALLRPDGDRPLPVTLDVPAGEYHVEAVSVPIPAMPWFRSYERWRVKAFLRSEPLEYVPLGTQVATTQGLALGLPPGLERRRIVGIRLTPPGAATSDTQPASEEDRKLRERLKALGYVN